MIVITTPTGQIGAQVLDHVLEGAEPVRLIARDPSRVDSSVAEHADIVEGSHADVDVLTEAFVDADSVFWLVPPNPRTDSVDGHYLHFTRALCEAVARQGVQRVVGVTTLGRGYQKNAGLLSGALAMDEVIENSGVTWLQRRPRCFWISRGAGTKASQWSAQTSCHQMTWRTSCPTCFSYQSGTSRSPKQTTSRQ